jgi:hypothetical protein
MERASLELSFDWDALTADALRALDAALPFQVRKLGRLVGGLWTYMHTFASCHTQVYV